MSLFIVGTRKMRPSPAQGGLGQATTDERVEEAFVPSEGTTDDEHATGCRHRGDAIPNEAQASAVAEG
jgi:hypothetical protein